MSVGTVITEHVPIQVHIKEETGPYTRSMKTRDQIAELRLAITSGKLSPGDMLRLDRRRAQARLQPLVDDALVRRVHVDDDQPVRVLGQHVDAAELGQRVAERPSWPSSVGGGVPSCERAASAAAARAPQRGGRGARLGAVPGPTASAMPSDRRPRRAAPALRSAAAPAPPARARHRQRVLDRVPHRLVHLAASRKRTSILVGCTLTSTRSGVDRR